jgi:hypothetical protein
MPGRRVPIRAGARSAATVNGNTAAMTAAGTVTTATIAMAGVVMTTVAPGMAMIAAGAMAAIERHRTKISCIKQLRRTGAATRSASLALSYAGLL